MSDTSITSSANERLPNSRPLNSKCHYRILGIFQSTLPKLIQRFHNIHVRHVCINGILFRVAHLLDYIVRGMDCLPIGVRFQLGASSFPFVITFIWALKSTQDSRGAYISCPWSQLPLNFDIDSCYFQHTCCRFLPLTQASAQIHHHLSKTAT